MKNKVYRLFAECFPELPIPEDIFGRLIDIDNCGIIPHFEDGIFAGCSVIQENNIRLVCVKPDLRGRGIGHMLMQKSEELIAGNGFRTAVLGGWDSGLFIGAVTPEEQWKNKCNSFFEKEGYRDCGGCLEMKMSLSDFLPDSAPPCPENVTFGYIEKSRREELLSAVEAVDDDWVQYFDFESPIFAAQTEGKIAGFCIIDVNAETIVSNGKNNVGIIGCVGVAPQYRRRGIGLAMVAKAMEDIKQKGCDDLFIHYTYLDRWYGKLGIKTFLYFRFGEKELDL